MLDMRIGNTILIIDVYKNTHTHTYISIYQDKKKTTKTTTKIFRKKVLFYSLFLFSNRQELHHRQAPNKYIMNLYHVHQLWLYD
jgi:hypothetical protein